MRALLITGLPACGKTTLARALARRYRIALLSKDTVKEALFATLGIGDADSSRRFSDASFAALFALAADLAAAGTDFILEGNFRRGEHEEALGSLPPMQLAQVLCRIDEGARLDRLKARATERTRHPGHADAQLSGQRAAADTLLELPCECIVVDGAGNDALERIDRFWRSAAGG